MVSVESTLVQTKYLQNKQNLEIISIGANNNIMNSNKEMNDGDIRTFKE